MHAESSINANVVQFAHALTQQLPPTLNVLCDVLAEALQAHVIISTLVASGEYHMVVECTEHNRPITDTFDVLNDYYRVEISAATSLDADSATIVQSLLEGWMERIRSSHTRTIQQQHLGDQQRMLETVINVLPEGVIVGLAPDGHLVLANRKAEEIWRHPLLNVPAEGYAAFGLLEKDGTPVAPENTGIGMVLRTHEPVLGRETIIQRPDGSRVTVLSNTSPIWRENGELLGAVSVFQDVTEWRLQAEERDHAISTIAHDLKNPLTTIRGSADMLLRRAISEARPEREIKRIEAIINQADRMKEFLMFLVDVARIEAGTMGITPQPANVNEMIQTLVDAVNMSTTKARVQLTMQQLPIMLLDPMWVERIIWNLVDNALKYSPAHTLVTVDVRLERDQWVTTIRDEGYGIDQADTERIFERFARSHHVPRDVIGTGLGLYTVRAIAKAHGGTIRVESAGLGQGSTFILTLPVT